MSGRPVLAVFAVLFALAALPLLSTPIPPLFDYPNHLGRMAILAANDGDSTLRQYYAVHWAILPNLAMDSIVPPLVAVMPLLDAGRLFLLATMLLLAAGPLLLHRVWWGRWSVWSCGGFLFLYSRVLLWGFVNYLAGIGLALCLLAGWSLLDRRSWLLRGMAGAAGASLVFFCHIEAFGVFALMLLGVEVPRLLTALRRGDATAFAARSAALVLALLPATILFLAVWQPHAGGGITLPRLDRKPDLLFSVFDNYSRPFDVACFVLLLVAAVIALWRSAIRFAAPAGGPVLLVTIFYLALPSTLLTGAGADHRLPVVLFLLAAAAIAPGKLSWRSAAIAAMAVATLFVLRMAIIEKVWLAAGARYRLEMTALAALPKGVRLAVAAPSAAVRVSAAPAYHMPVMAIALRQGFVPTLFAFPAQQPVTLRPPWAAVAAAADPDRVWRAVTASGVTEPEFRRFLLDNFDAVAVIGGDTPRGAIAACLIPIAAAPGLQLYRVAAVQISCPK